MSKTLFDSCEQEAIICFIIENEDQWNDDHWTADQRYVACFNFGREYERMRRKKAIEVQDRVKGWVNRKDREVEP